MTSSIALSTKVFSSPKFLIASPISLRRMLGLRRLAAYEWCRLLVSSYRVYIELPMTRYLSKKKSDSRYSIWIWLENHFKSSPISAECNSQAISFFLTCVKSLSLTKPKFYIWSPRYSVNVCLYAVTFGESLDFLRYSYASDMYSLVFCASPWPSITVYVLSK